MKPLKKQTTKAIKKAEVKADWYLIDANEKVLGKVASKVAKLLMGKNKAYQTSNLDCGDNVVVINSKNIHVTGKKVTDKMYYKHNDHLGSLKVKTFGQMQAKAPHKALEIAVKGMLPKNRMGREMFRKLHVYAESEHKQTAQQPKLIEI